jgi:hypothetical protein
MEKVSTLYMVRIMGKRMEKYRERRKIRFINFLKLNVVITLLILMVLFLFEINETIVALNCMENPNLLSIDLQNNMIHLLGKSYFVNLKYIVNLF